MRSTPRLALRLLGPFVWLALGGVAWAWWTLPTNWPVARLTQNLGRFVEGHPDDVDALYALGRIHAHAFAYETDRVALFEPLVAEEGTLSDEELARLVTRVAPATRQRTIFSRPGARAPLPLARTERLAHLEPALRNLQRARDLAPLRAEIHLSLACALEAGAPFAAEVDSAALLQPGQAAEKNALQPVERSTGGWLAYAARSYHRAFELAREADRALETQPMDDPFDDGRPLDALVSHEAGRACLRLGREPGIEMDAAFLTAVEAHLAALEAKPPSSWITPILLALDGCHSLAELVAPQSAVLFDLDGDGLDEGWPWIAPEAGWLVWDPEQTGSITSGRQLFGSASGWFFFRDGYRVLDALDDDGNGELRGAELTGIAVWFDRDSDGVSDRGEVVPAAALGIAALATEATERIGRSLGNPCGLEMADGRVLPTYDWVLSPADAP